MPAELTQSGSDMRPGLSASALKFIAIICMTIDHYAWLFVETTSVQGEIMHFFGRVTIGIMCFFISEGYHHTRSFPKYLLRMFVFAVLSHFPFALFHGKSLSYHDTESVIANLMLSLLAVHIVNHKKLDRALKVPLLILLLYFAGKCDWGVNAIYFTLAFELARDGGRKMQIIAYGIVVGVYLIPTFQLAFESWSFFRNRLYIFGLLLTIPLLLLYNGKRGGSSAPAARALSKWIFYFYYPAHLLMLYFLWRHSNGQ